MVLFSTNDRCRTEKHGRHHVQINDAEGMQTNGRPLARLVQWMIDPNLGLDTKPTTTSARARAAILLPRRLHKVAHHELSRSIGTLPHRSTAGVVAHRPRNGFDWRLIQLYQSNMDLARDNVRQARIARAVLTMIADDVRGVLRPMENDDQALLEEFLASSMSVGSGSGMAIGGTAGPGGGGGGGAGQQNGPPAGSGPSAGGQTGGASAGAGAGSSGNSSGRNPSSGSNAGQGGGSTGASARSANIQRCVGSKRFDQPSGNGRFHQRNRFKPAPQLESMEPAVLSRSTSLVRPVPMSISGTSTIRLAAKSVT